jgi:hypothetical protein
LPFLDILYAVGFTCILASADSIYLNAHGIKLIAILSIFLQYQMDRHKYVKVAYHGFREMSKEEKVAAYGSTLIRDSFDEPDYALIDTLFSLGEAYLFAQLVDFMDSNPGKVPSGTEYDHSCLYMFMIHAFDFLTYD